MKKQWAQLVNPLDPMPMPSMVNSAAISHDGQMVVAGTYYQPYPGTSPTRPGTDGTYGTYCFDASGNRRWRSEYPGNEGIYTVAISGDGNVVASGGLFKGGRLGIPPTECRVQAFDRDGGDLLTFNHQNHTRVNSVALSHDGSILATGAMDGELMVFVRSGSGKFQAPPQIVVPAGPRIDMVAVHPSGDYLIAAAWDGTVYLATLSNAVVNPVIAWQAPNKPRFLACALSEPGAFVVGGRNHLYLFTRASFTGETAQPFVDHFDLPDGHTQEDLRWLAMSADGSRISAVQNLGNDQAGLLLMFTNENERLIPRHEPITLNHNPNSTSLDREGKFVTVADGHPVGTSGTFSMFNFDTGEELKPPCPTPDMNWPMRISADGSAACGGSDDGQLFYFTP